jgi:hypothetical protein
MSQKEATVHHIHMYEVSDVANYQNYKDCFGFLVAQPKKYIGTHILLWCGALLYYICTAPRNSIPPGLIVISVILNVLIQIVLLKIGYTDPGMISKIMSSYENKKLIRIPLDKRY